MSNEYVEQIQPRNVKDIGDSVTLYTTRLDTVSTTSVTYVGKAPVGTATSEAKWQIQKLDESGSPETLVITWAGGNTTFDNVWDDRVSLNYS